VWVIRQTPSNWNHQLRNTGSFLAFLQLFRFGWHRRLSHLTCTPILKGTYLWCKGLGHNILVGQQVGVLPRSEDQTTADAMVLVSML
jgi:hypothetical protein